MQTVVRPASPLDIKAMHRVRLSVRENRLSQAAGITEETYLRFVQAGSAWVGELSGQVAGFAVVDATSRTVWALFVDPSAERLGVGKALHDCMLEWARERGLGKLTLVTSPCTRAAAFYVAAGWLREGISSTGEVCFIRALEPIGRSEAVHDHLPGTEESFALNRLSWDERVDSHIASAFYDVEGFRRGRDSLGPIESEEIGDVSGQRIAHLQCHFGLDSLSLARRGAKVTGLDFSEAAISAARQLAEETAVDASFVHGNVYDAPDLLRPGEWDLVYTSWGTITWLPDIMRWARVVAELLAPGGRLYFLDCHPVASALHQSDPTAPIQPAHDYFHGPAPLEFEDDGSYTGGESQFTQTRTHEWIHPLSAVVTALLEAGSRLSAVREHDRIAWQLYPSMIQAADGMWRLPPEVPRIPVAITIEAEKPGR